MTKKETKVPLKDNEFPKKLEEIARKMFGRAYRFLNSEQKKTVNAETKFEPALPEQSKSALNGEQTQTPAQKSNPAVTEDEEEAEASEVLTQIIEQFKCEKGHKTNGRPGAPAIRCRVCNGKVKKSGRYVNDVFEPIA